MVPTRRNIPGLAWHAGAIFMGAFLLFQLEPLIAKAVLPWFGGSAAVWTTCMLFFQVDLLLGYLYAHWATTRLAPRIQGWVHGALLAVSLALLPVIPSGAWKPSLPGDPTLRILGLLASTVGLPFFLLAATGPLLQAWWAGRNPGGTPYRLYALSNVGSLLALVSYPTLVEPYVGIRAQAWAWSAAYLPFVLLTLAVALEPGGRGPARPDPDPAGAAPSPVRVRLLWAALPAVASALLLAVTSHLTQNVAPIPFLWVLPLAIYLLSFIVCFDRASWYRRTLWLPLLAAALGGMAYSLLDADNLGIRAMVALFTAGLFCACMVCHGELARLKPHPRELTSFYLMIALGGGAGGLAVAVGAPRLLSGDYELPILLAGCAGLGAALCLRGRKPRALKALAAAMALALVVALGMGARAAMRDGRVQVRNFYGALRVKDEDQDPGGPVRTLMHGTIDHGEQYLSPGRSRQPTTYYGPGTGIGLALRALDQPGRKLGFIGLGAGTLAAYGRPGDQCRFYELNPLVLQLSRSEFRFLGECPAQVTCVLGDARLSLEREPPQAFDLLAVDAFSGDAIPVHLLTREAFQLYFRHLRPGGLLAVHISNRYLDLAPVVGQAAQDLGKETMEVSTPDDDANDVFAATWVLVTGDPAQFRRDLLFRAGRPVPPRLGFRAWTDDYSNLFQVLN